MSDKKTVPVLVQTTKSVAQKQAFDFWRSAVMSGVDLTPLDSALPFSAGRKIAASKHGGIIHTVSGPYILERTTQHVRRDGRDDVGVMLIVRGHGYIEQGNNGALLNPGDITFHNWARPGAGGGLDDFEELRLAIPRATFQAQIGNVQDFGGLKLNATPLSGLFAAYLNAFANSIADMSEAETGIAVEGTLHLLRGVVNGQSERAGAEISTDALRSLALAHIERRLHDAEFGPDLLAADLRVSRSRLYAAFAGGEGIAGTIREARLDRAHHRLVMLRKSGARVAAVMASCGFTDAAAFSRAFRRRFGLSPRDLLAQQAC